METMITETMAISRAMVQIRRQTQTPIRGQEQIRTEEEKAEEGSTINVDMNGSTVVPVDIVNNITGERYSIQLSLAYEGEFGFTAVLSIGLGRENAGYTASLYYYNKSTGELEFICADEIEEDGTVSLAFTHASDYVIAIDGKKEEESGTGETAQ